MAPRTRSEWGSEGIKKTQILRTIFKNSFNGWPERYAPSKPSCVLDNRRHLSSMDRPRTRLLQD